jgi:hypothetical protein
MHVYVLSTRKLRHMPVVCAQMPLPRQKVIKGRKLSPCKWDLSLLPNAGHGISQGGKE